MADRTPDIDEAAQEAQRLNNIFGAKASLVVDELISASYGGYDYDRDFELPLYEAIKKKLEEI